MLNLDNTPQRQSFYATAAICFLRKADLLSSAVQQGIYLAALSAVLFCVYSRLKPGCSVE